VAPVIRAVRPWREKRSRTDILECLV
jgi:hypothetical protein